MPHAPYPTSHIPYPISHAIKGKVCYYLPQVLVRKFWYYLGRSIQQHETRNRIANLQSGSESEHGFEACNPCEHTGPGLQFWPAAIRIRLAGWNGLKGKNENTPSEIGNRNHVRNMVPEHSTTVELYTGSLASDFRSEMERSDRGKVSPILPIYWFKSGENLIGGVL